MAFFEIFQGVSAVKTGFATILSQFTHTKIRRKFRDEKISYFLKFFQTVFALKTGFVPIISQFTHTNIRRKFQDQKIPHIF